MTYRLIAFDLDGTLTKSRTVIAQDQAKYLSRLLNFYQVAITSGADWPQFKRQLINHLPARSNQLANLHLLPTNGGQLYQYQSGRWRLIWSQLLTKADKIKIHQALKQTLTELKINIPASQISGQQLVDRGSQITWSAFGQQAPLSLKQTWDPDHRRRRLIIDQLTSRLPNYEIKSGGTTSIDITPKGQTKAAGLKKLSRQLKLPQTKVLYIGDALFPGGNDYSVKQAGFATWATNGPTATRAMINQLINQAKYDQAKALG